jgi:hypothetical protein
MNLFFNHPVNGTVTAMDSLMIEDLDDKSMGFPPPDDPESDSDDETPPPTFPPHQGVPHQQ